MEAATRNIAGRFSDSCNRSTCGAGICGCSTFKGGPLGQNSWGLASAVTSWCNPFDLKPNSYLKQRNIAKKAVKSALQSDIRFDASKDKSTVSLACMLMRRKTSRRCQWHACWCVWGQVDDVNARSWCDSKISKLSQQKPYWCMVRQLGENLELLKPLQGYVNR